MTVWKTTIRKREKSAVTFPLLKKCKTVITPNRQPCFWHVQITRPNNTGWPVTSPVLFNQAKNSCDKALMAKSGQKHGHYLALRRFCGVGNCLKIFFGTLMSCSNWAEKSSDVVAWGRGRNRRTGSSGTGRILIFQRGGRAKGRERRRVKVGPSKSRRSAQATNIRLQSTSLRQVHSGYGSTSHVHWSIRRICS